MAGILLQAAALVVAIAQRPLLPLVELSALQAGEEAGEGSDGRLHYAFERNAPKP